MNLLEQLTHYLTPQSKYIATIVGERDGVWVGKTLDEAIILLKVGSVDIKVGDKIYYDKITGTILGIAPQVNFEEYGV